MANEEPKTLRDHYTPTTYTSSSCIRLPNVTADHFEIKASTIQMLPSFHGLNNENPYKHLDEFLEICTTFKLPNFTDEAIRLRLFPFSLKDKAKHWLHSLEANTISSWTQMQQEFLKKYFPMGKTNQIRRAITSFAQFDGEQFHESWERLKELIRSCPHHAVPRWQLVQCFYDGLMERNRQMVDASCGGTFMLKNENEAWELFENLSENSLQHVSSSRSESHTHSSSNVPKKGGIYEISHNSDLSDKVDALSKKLDQMMSSGTQFIPPMHANYDVCALCWRPFHCVNDCPSAPHFPEFVQE